jgi:hypothetical protein
MFLKIHRPPHAGTVVAVCDRELINTILTDGDLEVRITESFYGNRCVPEQEVAEALRGADNANIIGRRAVALAIGLGIITESSCIMIGQIPHAQIFGL